MKIKNSKNSGTVMCLGWCGKSFFSVDKINLRFCQKCKEKKQAEIERSSITSKKCCLDISHD